MNTSTHCARVVGPISYLASPGLLQSIPVGPCLVENPDGQSIEIIWGAQGQCSAALDGAAFASAQAQGNLVLLD